MPPPVAIGEIVGLLASRIDALCLDLLPAGVREGREWRVGSVAGEAGRSMAVHLDGPRAGVWCDWAGRAEDRGDALDLVAAVLFAGDKKRALRWARGWLGLERIDPAAMAIQRRAIEKRRRDQSEDEGKRQAGAMRIFLEARPALAGTPSADYLAGRGIELALLGRQPRALRHHVGLVHPETGEICPTMVAAITAPDGRMVAVHRTFLEARPGGGWAKLSGVKDAKLTLGRYAGGFIRLWRGASGKSLKDAIAGEWVMISEGIEDGLSAVLAAPELRAIAAVSGGNLSNIDLPPAIAGVLILEQNDGSTQARETLARAVKRFRDEGKRVRLARPNVHVKDINELLQRSVALPHGVVILSGAAGVGEGQENG